MAMNEEGERVFCIYCKPPTCESYLLALLCLVVVFMAVIRGAVGRLSGSGERGGASHALSLTVNAAGGHALYPALYSLSGLTFQRAIDENIFFLLLDVNFIYLQHRNTERNVHQEKHIEMYSLNVQFIKVVFLNGRFCQ